MKNLGANVLCVGGTAVLGYGLWLYSPALSLSAGGLLAIVAGIALFRTANTKEVRQ